MKKQPRPGPQNLPVKVINQYETPGRNGNRDKHIYVQVGGKKGPMYYIQLHCEYIRINKAGKQENIYRCIVKTHPTNYPLYSRFEHPDCQIEHFLRKAKVLPDVPTTN